MKQKKKLGASDILLLFCGSVLCALFFFLMINYYLYALVWVCLVPIFYALFRTSNKHAKAMSGILCAFLIFLSFYWIAQYDKKLYWMSSIVVSLFGLLITASYAYTSKYFKKGIHSILFLPAVWLILALIFSFYKFGNTWMLFGYFFPTAYPLGYILGPLFYSIFIIFCNSLLAHTLFTKKKQWFIVCIICALLVSGSFMYSTATIPRGEELNVLLVQGYVRDSWFTRIDNAHDVLSKYESLTLKHKGKDIDLILWPEYAVPADFEINKSFHQRLENLSTQMNSYIALGTYSFVNKNDRGYRDKKYNVALIYAPNGELIDTYHATKTIGFYNETKDADFDSETINLDEFSFNIGLCFEEYVNEGNLKESDGDFITILTNNQHFDNTAGIKLISQFSKLKALEKHKYVLRVTNTGTTHIVNPYGVTVAELSTHESETLLETIYI